MVDLGWGYCFVLVVDIASHILYALSFDTQDDVVDQSTPPTKYSPTSTPTLLPSPLTNSHPNPTLHRPPGSNASPAPPTPVLTSNFKLVSVATLVYRSACCGTGSINNALKMANRRSNVKGLGVRRCLGMRRCLTPLLEVVDREAADGARRLFFRLSVCFIKYVTSVLAGLYEARYAAMSRCVV